MVTDVLIKLKEVFSNTETLIFLGIVCAVAFISLGITLFFQRNIKKPKTLQNILIGVLVMAALPIGMSMLNNLPKQTHVVAENTAKVAYLNVPGFEKEKYVSLANINTLNILPIEDEQTGRIIINAIDSETGKALPGCVFVILNEKPKYASGYNPRYDKDKLIETITTDKNGSAVSSNLKFGDYYVVCDTAPYGYNREAEIIKPPNSVPSDWSGKPILHNIILNQQGDAVINTEHSPSKIKIPFMTFGFFGGVNGGVYDIYADGDVILNGDVKYKDGELLDTVCVEWSKENEDNHGSWPCTPSKKLYLGNYTVVERTAPPNYVALRPTCKLQGVWWEGMYDSLPSHVGETEPFYLELYYTLQEANIEVTKQTEILTGFKSKETEFGMLNEPIYELENVPDVTYEVYAAEDIFVEYADNSSYKPSNAKQKMNSKGDLVDTITTNADGKATSVNLLFGEYLVKEVHYLDGEPIVTDESVVDLSYKGQDIKAFTEYVTFTDELAGAKTKLKTAIEKNKYYPNPEAYQDIGFGIFNDEDIKDDEGNVLLEKGSLVDCFGVDQAGQGVSALKLPYAKYHIEELKTAEGYVLNKNHYPFEFKPQDQRTPLLWIDLNADGTVIDNETIKGRVHIEKTSSFDSRSLPGAIYGIFRASDDELLMTLKTETNDFDGSAGATSELLPYGRYYLKEITPPNRYHLDIKEQLLSIGEHGEETITHNFDLTGEPIIGTLALFYNEKGLKEKLDGSLMPQTGDNSYLNLALGGAAISGFVVLALVIKRSRKRRKRSDN